MADTPVPGEPSGFGSRGRARRRVRFLRKARELAYRDLGGLVFNLHRFGQRNDTLVLAKLTTLGHIDGELRTIEAALQEREPVTVLREAGITACPRCAAIHSSEDRFCPNCGLPMSRHVDLPVAGAAAAPTPPATVSPPPPIATDVSTHVPAPAQIAPVAAPVPAPSPSPQPTVQAPEPAAGEPAPAAEPPPAADAHPPVAARQPSAEEATEIIRPGSAGP